VPPGHEPDIRVRIAEVDPGAAARVGARGARLRVRIAQMEGQETAPAGERAQVLSAPVEISHSAAGWAARDAAGARATWPAQVSQLRVDAATGAPQVEWNGSQWPGSMRLVRIASGATDVVMDVPMETYLPGVVAKELYGSWDLDTFKAQAIAARSYAVVEDDRWSDRRHYDVVAGEQSQAWIGATQNPTALQAVRETRGMVLVHDGLVVPAYYSSACGGRPATARGAITDNPHHEIAPIATGDGAARSGCCERTKVATWKASIPVPKVAERLRAWGRSNWRPDVAAIESISAIAPARRNVAGRTVAFTLTTPKGSVTIGAEELRTAINAARDRATSIRSSDCTITLARGSMEFSGRGFGHGAGMCQHGAQEMARRGTGWREILARYYPESSVETAWR
jgi:stage II sporulation protein D